MADEVSVTRIYGASLTVPAGWEGAVRVAAGQQDLIAIGQLRELGLSKDKVGSACRSLRIHRMRLSIYAHGTRRWWPQRRMWSGLLLGGPGTAVAARTALVAHGVLAWKDGEPIEIRSGSRVRRPGITWCGRAAARVVLKDGVPPTTVSMALVDLARSGHPDLLVALNEADVKGLLDPAEIRALRPPETLTRLLPDERSIPKSRLERRFDQHVAPHLLAMPEPTVWVETARGVKEIDRYWPHARYGIELDGRSVHDRLLAADRDRDKDLLLAHARIELQRLTWNQLVDELLVDTINARLLGTD